jgi:O-succinylbenzoic acid--CoA ligase
MYGDHEFKFLGRSDNLINSGGIKIQLEQLEQQIAQTGIFGELHQDFALSWIKDEQLGQKIILVLANKDQVQPKKLEELKAILPKYRAPQELASIPTIPKLPSGKVDRQVIKRFLENG